MPKINKEEKESHEMILSLDQLRNFAKELEATSKEEFLIARQTIKIQENGHWVIMSYEGLGNAGIEAFGGYVYQTDVPYTLWSEVLRQVEGYMYRKDMAEKERLEILAKHQ